MSSFSDKLLKWYFHNRRVLPWREDPTPYHVWLSEIMLQQTRVEAVRGYYSRFLDHLPDVSSLAQASEETCLKLWEGLGYYSRVRNLRKGAVWVMENCGGQVPSSASELIRIPGIGKYTAAAIASIAFGERVPAVDGNLLRIYARLALYEENIRTPAAQKSAAAYFLSLMPEQGELPEGALPEGSLSEGALSEGSLSAGNPCGNFNQALMDLGNAVCFPNAKPDCGKCPVSDFCLIHRHRPGAESDLPLIPAAKDKKTEYLTVFLIRIGDRTAVRKRPARGLLAGLYEFPNAPGALEVKEAVSWLRENGIEPLRIKRICDAEHIFTHKKWIMRGYEVQTDPFAQEEVPFIMADPEEIRSRYCIPSAFSGYLGWLGFTGERKDFGKVSLPIE